MKKNIEIPIRSKDDLEGVKILLSDGKDLSIENRNVLKFYSYLLNKGADFSIVLTPVN
jgi:hypothetical protein